MTLSGGAGTLNSFSMTMPMVRVPPLPRRLHGFRRTCPVLVSGCGAEATRTPGLLHAMQALYQLSYSPVRPNHSTGPSSAPPPAPLLGLATLASRERSLPAPARLRKGPAPLRKDPPPLLGSERRALT